jgi:hypothetical protein
MIRGNPTHPVLNYVFPRRCKYWINDYWMILYIIIDIPIIINPIMIINVDILIMIINPHNIPIP